MIRRNHGLFNKDQEAKEAPTSVPEMLFAKARERRKSPILPESRHPGARLYDSIKQNQPWALIESQLKKSYCPFSIYEEHIGAYLHDQGVYFSDSRQVSPLFIAALYSEHQTLNKMINYFRENDSDELNRALRELENFYDTPRPAYDQSVWVDGEACSLRNLSLAYRRLHACRHPYNSERPPIFYCNIAFAVWIHGQLDEDGINSDMEVRTDCNGPYYVFRDLLKNLDVQGCLDMYDYLKKHLDLEPVVVSECCFFCRSTYSTYYTATKFTIETLQEKVMDLLEKNKFPLEAVTKSLKHPLFAAAHNSHRVAPYSRERLVKISGKLKNENVAKFKIA